jgi:hypothetical protein
MKDDTQHSSLANSSIYHTVDSESGQTTLATGPHSSSIPPRNDFLYEIEPLTTGMYDCSIDNEQPREELSDEEP